MHANSLLRAKLHFSISFSGSECVYFFYPALPLVTDSLCAGIHASQRGSLSVIPAGFTAINSYIILVCFLSTVRARKTLRLARVICICADRKSKHRRRHRSPQIAHSPIDGCARYAASEQQEAHLPPDARFRFPAPPTPARCIYESLMRPSSAPSAPRARALAINARAGSSFGIAFLSLARRI